jgi:TPR repeat protein
MKLWWKIAIAIACVALVCGASILWRVHKRKARALELAAIARVRAEQGEAKAQSELASMYFYGRGVPQDYAEARRWARKAADQGYATAQEALGDLYYHGRAVPQDYAEAARWYRKAADQGDVEAQNSLGYMYYYGQGVSQDFAEAVRWYRKAADRGYVNAQLSVASFYYQGIGVPRDYFEAVRWYRRAADQGELEGQYDLAYMYDHGQGVPHDHAEAVRWYRRAADRGSRKALSALGLIGSIRYRKLRFIRLLVVFLAGMFFLLNFLLGGRNLRTRPHAVPIVLGTTCLLYVGLSLYGIAHDDMRGSVCANAFYLTKGLLIGVTIVLGIAILLTNGQKKKEPQDPAPASSV